MQKTLLQPKNFTHIMGSYSHGVRVDMGDSVIIFVTGQIVMDKDGNAVAPDDITAQTEFIFQNIVQILEDGNSSIDDVVKATIFVTNMDDFGEISKIRNKYFKNARPVSTLVEINRTVKEGCDVEIEVIAISKK